MIWFWRSALILWAASGVAQAYVVRVVFERSGNVGGYVKQGGHFCSEIDPNFPNRGNSPLNVRNPENGLRFLVPEDADRLVREAEASGVLR